MSEKELIWVEKDFAEKYKKIESNEEKIRLFESYMKNLTESVKDEYKNSIKVLDEESKIFAGMMLKTKKVFGEALQNALDSSYDVWEKFDKQRADIHKKAVTITDELEPMEDKLTNISNLISKINTYNFDRLYESVSKISSLDGKGLRMLEFLIENYKIPEGGAE